MSIIHTIGNYVRRLRDFYNPNCVEKNVHEVYPTEKEIPAKQSGLELHASPNVDLSGLPIIPTIEELADCTNIPQYMRIPDKPIEDTKKISTD